MKCVVISAEHASHTVPRQFKQYFRGAASILRTHHGWDPGTPELAARIATRFGTNVISATTSRLLVDYNRTPQDSDYFSEFSQRLAPSLQDMLTAEYYLPHRAAVAKEIEASGVGTVIHISVHSFAPVVDGKPRRADIGLLYDPSRPAERRLADKIHHALEAHNEELVMRRNYPYSGRSSGLTTFFRKCYSPRRYLGLELEVNQRLITPKARWEHVQRVLVDALSAAIGR